MDVLLAGDPHVLSAPGSLDRPIRWVHVTEVNDVAGLLGGQELILTTGMPLASPDFDSVHYIQQLAAADACGVVVELSQRLAAIPQEVIEEADRLGLPVIELRRPVRFVAVTEEVHRLIVGEQYRHLTFAHHMHEVFTSLSLDSSDAMTIVNAAADFVGGPVVLEDLSHRVVAFCAHGRSDAALLADWERRSRLTPSVDGIDPAGPENWVTTPVGLRGERWARLIAIDSAVEQEQLGMLLERAAGALQLTRLVERDRSGIWFQAQETLLNDLVGNRVKIESEALARSAALGLPRAKTHVAAVAYFPQSRSDDPLVARESARRHAEDVTKALSDCRVHALVGGLGAGKVGLILALENQDAEDKALARISRSLGETARSRNLDKFPLIGAAASAQSLLTAASRLHIAEHIAEAASALRPLPSLPFFRSTDVRLRGLISQIHDDHRVQSFAESELSPLLSYEAEHGDELVELLRQFLACGGNKSRLAQLSHRSRPSLYNKLRTLESILLVDLADPESLMSLGVALLIHDQHKLAGTDNM